MNAAVKGKHWTEDEDNELRRRRAAGESARQIRDGMGLYTRNQVIGRLHRLGLTSGDRHAPAPRRSGPKQPVVNVLRSSRASKSTLAIYGDRATDKTRQTPPQPVLGGRRPAPNSRFIKIDELERTNCHWPIGDLRAPDFFFCGALKEDNGFPYCDHHHRLAYVKPGPKRHNFFS